MISARNETVSSVEIIRCGFKGKCWWYSSKQILAHRHFHGRWKKCKPYERITRSPLSAWNTFPHLPRRPTFWKNWTANYHCMLFQVYCETKYRTSFTKPEGRTFIFFLDTKYDYWKCVNERPWIWLGTKPQGVMWPSVVIFGKFTPLIHEMVDSILRLPIISIEGGHLILCGDAIK